jgi:hypothetical protein
MGYRPETQSHTQDVASFDLPAHPQHTQAAATVKK